MKSRVIGLMVMLGLLMPLAALAQEREIDAEPQAEVEQAVAEREREPDSAAGGDPHRPVCGSGADDQSAASRAHAYAPGYP